MMAPQRRRCRRHVSVVALIAVLTIMLIGCLEPELVDEAPTTGGDLPDTADHVPVDDGQLRTELRQLHDTLDALDELYDTVQNAPSAATARSAGLDALARLVDLHDTRLEAQPPLLPAVTADRAETPQRPAQLLTLLTTAQDTGGPLAREVVAALSDTVAGDLGGWLRDAEGMVEMTRTVAMSSDSIEDLEPAVIALAGEATRALAWTFVIAEAADTDRATAAAERAQAHIGLIRTALEAAGASRS
ncbi:MAG: hypothetical protein WD576_02805 [Nitriliruptoraceae bacterium]